MLRRIVHRVGCYLSLVRYLRAELAILRIELEYCKDRNAQLRVLLATTTEAPAVATRRPLHRLLNNDPPPPDPVPPRDYLVRDFTLSPIVAEVVGSVNVAMTTDS